MVKNLGLTIDKNLNFQTHIDTMTVEILVAVSHARHVISGQALKIIVESLVLSCALLFICLRLVRNYPSAEDPEN